MQNSLITFAQRFLPLSTRRKIIRYTRWPPVGMVFYGSLRRVKPISPDWGTERGMPVDRYYIERFLAENSHEIQGRVLEIGENTYTLKYGGKRVRQSEVLHVAEQKSQVTVIANLTDGAGIASNAYDCLVLTQTLQTIFEVDRALLTVYRILKPGGVVLATVPGISKISRYDMDRWGYYWSFTTMSMQRLFERSFPKENIQINACGNVLASIAFLHGLAASELRRKELDYIDPDYELLITVRAVKPEDAE